MPKMISPSVALWKIKDQVRENTSARETISSVRIVSRPSTWPTTLEFTFRSGESLKWCIDEIKMILRNLRLVFDNDTITFGKKPRTIQVEVLL